MRSCMWPLKPNGSAWVTTSSGSWTRRAPGELARQMSADDDRQRFLLGMRRGGLLRAELDAYYAKLYSLTRKQLRYVLDPHGLSERELADILDSWEDPTCSGPHLLPSEPTLDFPGETLRVLKQKEEKQFSEYRTRRLVLEAWERRCSWDSGGG